MLNKLDVPCGPILSMKEIADEPSLRETGTVVEVDHPKRGKCLTVGKPIKMSDSPTEVTRSPLLGEHTEEMLRNCGFQRRRHRRVARRRRDLNLRQGTTNGLRQDESSKDPRRVKAEGRTSLTAPGRQASVRCLRNRRCRRKASRRRPPKQRSSRRAWAFQSC